MAKDTSHHDRVFVRGQWLVYRIEKTALGFVGFYDVDGVQARTEPCKRRGDVPGQMADLLKAVLKQREQWVRDRKKLEAWKAGKPWLRPR